MRFSYKLLLKLKPLLLLAGLLIISSCSSLDLSSTKNEPPLSKSSKNQEKINQIKVHQLEIDNDLKAIREAWANDDLDRLETLYSHLSSIDPENLRAKEGVKFLSLAKKHQILLSEIQLYLNESTDQGDQSAKEKLQQILLERPFHPVAKKLYDNLLLKEEARVVAKQHKKLNFKDPITLKFRDVNLKMIFESLSASTKINFILDKDLPSDQKATIFIDNMPFAEALDLLLETNKLDKKILSEKSVVIFPNNPLRERDYRDLTVRNFNLEYATITQATTVLRSMLNIKKIESDARLNSIMIKDTPEVIAIAEKIIKSIDLPDPEVMLEMEVLEVSRSRLQNLGVKFPTSFNVAIPDAGLTVRELKNTNFNDLKVGGTPSVLFNGNDSDVNLLANPRIRVKNKDVAKIHIGDKVPVFSANVSSTGVTAANVQYIDVGLKLEAEPTISNSGDVTIKINLNVGSLGDLISSGTGQGVSSAYKISTRMTSTQLRLHDGETQVLAGLIDDQDRKNIDKIPGAGSLPLLGRLFSSHRDDKSKTEIVLLITPHIIRERGATESYEKEYWTGTEAETGKGSNNARFQEGIPLFITAPKPDSSSEPKVSPEAKPQNLNIQLPPSLNLPSPQMPGE